MKKQTYIHGTVKPKKTGYIKIKLAQKLLKELDAVLAKPEYEGLPVLVATNLYFSKIHVDNFKKIVVYMTYNDIQGVKLEDFK